MIETESTDDQWRTAINCIAALPPSIIRRIVVGYKWQITSWVQSIATVTAAERYMFIKREERFKLMLKRSSPKDLSKFKITI